MSEKESAKFARLKDKIERLKVMGVPSSSSVPVSELPSSSSMPVKEFLVLEGETSSLPSKRAREDMNFSTPKIVKLSAANAKVVETQVHIGGSIPYALRGRQRIGYITLLKSLRKECFELKYNFSKVGHGMEGHDAMEASLMRSNFTLNSYFH